jgi:NADPH:quinone reductase
MHITASIRTRAMTKSGAAQTDRRAAVVRRLGVVAVEEEIPGHLSGKPPAAGYVRLSVAFSGVNMADVLRVRGQYQERDVLPFVPGAECSGIISAVGHGVSNPELAVNTPVLALCLKGGSFATDIDVPAEHVFVVPPEFGPIGHATALARAAAVPIACGTAWLAWNQCGLHDRLQDAKPNDEQWVLVTGASGGAGSAAVLLAKALGYKVVATARGAVKVRFCKESLLSDCVIDVGDVVGGKAVSRTVRDVCPHGVEAAFDAVGGELLMECIRAVRWGGRVAIIGFASGVIPRIPANVLLVKGVSVVGVYFGSDMTRRPREAQRLFGDMLKFIALKRIHLPICACASLDDVADALDLARTGRVMGKVLIACGPSITPGERAHITANGLSGSPRSKL